VTAWQAERRRAQSSKFQSENARALANLIGAVGDAGDYVEGIDEKKRKREQEDADRTAKTAERESLMSSRDKGAEASLLRAQGANDASMMRAKADVDEAEAKRKAEADKAERDSKVLREKSSMEVLRAAARDPSANVETLIGRAVADPELGNLDDTAVAGIMAEERAKAGAEAAKTDATEALGAQREADAKKKARLPAPKAPKNQTVAATPLRKEFNALPSVKAAADSSANFDTMTNASKDPSAAGDLALIFTFMKILDPGSVVKETEFANAQNAAGVDDRVRNAWNRTLSGERLSTAQRADFLAQAQGLRDQAVARANAEIQRYSDLATKSGLDPVDVVGAPRAAAPAASAAAPAASAKVRVSNGQEILEIDKADLGDALADGYKVVR
jgi:hypothetical protein